MSCQIKWMNCGVHSFAKPVCEESGGARFRKAICFIASFTFLLHLLSRFKKPCLPTSPAYSTRSKCQVASGVCMPTNPSDLE